MYLKIFLADFAVFCVFWGISRDFAEIPEFRGSATTRNIRSPVKVKTAVSLLNPKAISNFCFLRMPELRKLIFCVWMFMTCKQLFGKFKLFIA